jgi:hypothetical protein
MIRYSILVGIVVCPSWLLAQRPGGESAGEAGGPRPRLELARSLQSLDEALAQMRAATEALAETRRLAEAAEQQGKAAEVERVVRLAAELQVQVDGCVQALRQRLRSLEDLRRTAEAEAPATLLAAPEDASVADLRKRILAACALPKHTDAERELEQIEASLTAKNAPKLEGGAGLLGFVRYRRGEVMRQHAALLVRKRTANSDTESIRMLKWSKNMFASVLEAPDSAEGGEATSLHAAALLRVVQIEASLFDAYAAVGDRESRSRRAAAETALDRLKRGYADARLASGESVVALAEAKVRQLVR